MIKDSGGNAFLVLVGAVKTGALLLLSALAVIYFIQKSTSLELSVLSVLGVFFTFLSLGDLGVGPTLTRKLAKLNSKGVGVSLLGIKIVRFYFYFSMILLLVCVVSYFVLNYSFSWNNQHLLVFAVWAGAGVVNARYSYLAIFLVGFGYIQKNQIGMMANKFIFLITFVLFSQYFSLLSSWALAFFIGVLMQVAINNSYYKRIKYLNDSSDEYNGSFKELMFKSGSLGGYYLSSLVISKSYLYYINADPAVDGVDMMNVVEKFLSYVFMIANVPTTFLITRYIEMNVREEFGEAYRIVILSMGVFIVLSLFVVPLLLLNINLLNYIGISLDSYVMHGFVIWAVVFVIFDEFNKHVNTYLYAAGKNEFIIRNIILVFLIVCAFVVFRLLDASNEQFIIFSTMIYVLVYNVNFIRLFK